jgi:hypothetical protein
MAKRTATGAATVRVVADLTPGQQAMRDRVEGLIGLAAPFLDVVLGIGERISRIAEPTDHEYYPIRPGPEGSLPGEVEEGPDRGEPAAAAAEGTRAPDSAQ